MSDPRVSVVLSVYNGDRFIREAIESVLSQTFREFEFLIIDDGSTDRSREIICSYDDSRIRFIENTKNLGLTRSLNVGLRQAHAPLIARQDADDISHPLRLEKQVGFMDLHPTVALLGTQAQVIDADGVPIAYPEHRKATQAESILWQMAVDSAFVHTSVIFRRDVVLGRLGGYDETYTNGQDADLWSRLAGKYGVRNLPDTLVRSRVHAGSISVRKRFVTPDAIRRGESIYLRTLRRVVPSEIVPDDWVPLYVGVYVGRIFSAVETDTLFQGLRSIGRYFSSVERNPVVTNEFRCVLSAKFMLLAAHFRSSHPLLAARAFSNAVHYERGIVSSQLRRHFGRGRRRLSPA